MKKQKRESKPKFKFKIKPLLVSSVILFVLLVASILTRGFDIKDRLGGVSKEEISQKAINFVNNNLLAEGVKASLVSVVFDDSGLYKLTLDVQGQEFETYVSRDGNIIFPQGISMKEQAASDGDDSDQTKTQTDIPKTEAPDVKLFVMSYCPYGNQAEDVMKPVVDLLKDQAKIKVHYVIYSNYADGYPDYCLDKANKYCSMHGIEELNQDIREICVQKYNPAKFWPFLKEINANTTAENVDGKWEKIAQNLGINVSKIKDCQAKEAETLLQTEVQLSQKHDVSGSPALVINDTVYSGGRTSNAYKEAICSAFKTAPKACSTELSDVANDASSGDCQ